MTANMLYRISLCVKGWCAIDEEVDLQQVSDTSLYSKDASPGQIGAESPGCDLQASVCRCPNDLDPLVHTSNSQGRLVVLFTSRQSLPLSVDVIASDVDVPAVDGAIMPLGFDDVMVCD
jgi:hypothetical protein